MLPLHCSLSYAYMQVYVSSNYLSTSKAARVTARKIGDIPCRKFLSKLYHGQDYYTLEDALVRPINRRYYSLHIVTEYMYTHTHTHTHTHTCRSAAVRTTYFSDLLLNPRPNCYSLGDFFRNIEENNSKSDFLVGLEAR